MRFVAPWKVLVAVAVALGAVALIVLSVSTVGEVSGIALLAVGQFDAIMFPTIFHGLGQPGTADGRRVRHHLHGNHRQGDHPPLTGFVADLSTLRIALIVPTVCYVDIAA